MRLLCNFVNVYTIVYIMYSTRTRVQARIPTDILARKSARRTKVRGQVGELNGPRAPRQADDIRGYPRAEVGEEVLVGVRVGPVEFKLNRISSPSCSRLFMRCSLVEGLKAYADTVMTRARQTRDASVVEPRSSAEQRLAADRARQAAECLYQQRRVDGSIYGLLYSSYTLHHVTLVIYL